MFLDDASGILLAGPMLMPIMAAIGVDPVHFGAILGVNLGMGLITPPTAPILYFAGAVGKASLPSMLGPTLHFIFLCYLPVLRSEEHTSELQSLLLHSYALFCL